MSAPAARRLLFTSSLLSVLAFVGLVSVHVSASSQPSAPPGERSGQDVYRAACAACHGADGKGMPQSQVGFDLPLPDFSDCSFATVEPSADWFAVAHDGGPVRAFDRRMPAFGEALPERDLEAAVAYLHEFCTDTAWPRGELNLPRPLVTEKAYPENEAVLTTTVATSGEGSVENEFLYEHRLGARSQYEVVVPIVMAEPEGQSWRRGLGDVAVALKSAVFHSLETGNIFTVGGELIFPTGKENEGLGKGATVFEPFVAFGQILPSDGFLQLHGGMEIPTEGDKEAFWRAALGKSFVEGRFGRTWSPMVEVLGAREIADGHEVEWDVVPQMQVTLNTRQHIMLNAGVRIPVNERDGRSTQAIVYLLWDWFDGGLFDGW
jgi:mono/diheme cytochrome c family protein